MFQFRRFPSHTYFIQHAILEYCSSVLPHSDISGSSLICSSPKLFAACHVLHRLLMPRHSPCALISLTYFSWSLKLVLLNYAGPTEVVYKIVFTLSSDLIFRCSFLFQRNKHMKHGSSFSVWIFIQTEPNLKFHNLLLKVWSLKITPSVALLFLHLPLFSFQGAAEGCTLKIEQCRTRKGLT